ncbi:MAG: extracellular solute-binding protein [Clostridiales bacterium]|jgi:multiple sugar transport system substrate-binding protein/putative aldouronate transport system substrate-binding protein|nr:sugar ABC transporter substrate-binding protein [Bacillota bacterium]NLK03113.1 extracellular solute-binding protein [Clostridiales bacterium]
MKKQFRFIIVAMLVMAMLVTGCGKKDKKDKDTGLGTGSDLEHMVIEVYSQPANFQGEQPGWTAKILKDKFNITLNIIAPQVAGGDIFAARSASGFLGDLVVLDNADIQACIKSGLIYDVSDHMKKMTSFEEFKNQLDVYNSSLDGVGEGVYYAWPTEMTNTSPTTFTPTIPGTAPTIPWDYYAEVGAPEMENLSDLVKTLRAIQDLHPTNAAGDPSYGITLWPDWDGTSIENVNQLTKWYGQEVNGSILLDTSGNMIELTDDSGAYRRILQFFFEANQAGVVDPDSGTQNWDSVNSKFNSKRAFLIWNDWQQGFWNTTERGNNRENYMMVPINDMNIYQPSDPFFGSGRAFAVGTKDPAKQERVMMLLDWMSSPDGLETIHGGIKGFNYEDAPDGKGYIRTPIGETALMDNSPVPEEFGGGLYADGMLQINQWMQAGVATNPKTGYGYVGNLWPAEVEKAKTATTKEWSERFDAENPVDYLIKNNKTTVVPFVNVNLAPDTTDIALIRSNCATLVKDASWKMVFAKDQAEFDSIWNTLKEDLDGFDWNKLVEFDKEKLQVLVDERAKALNSN